MADKIDPFEYFGAPVTLDGPPPGSESLDFTDSDTPVIKTSGNLETQKFIDRNVKDGVKLDVTSGYKAVDRIAASFRSNDPEQELRWWKDKYGPDAVRRLDDGSIALRTYKNDKPIDVRVDEYGTTYRDLADIANISVEIAGDVAALALTRKWHPSGFGRRIVQSAIGAAGAQSAGAASDIAFDAYDSGDVDWLGTLEDRGKLGLLDAVLGFGGAKFIDTMGSAGKLSADAFGSMRGNTQEEYLEALNFIQRKTGVKIDSTAAQATGDPKLARLETLVANVPGGQEAFQEFKRLQTEAIEAIQKRLMGIDERGPIPSEEQLSTDVMDSLRAKIDQVDGAAKFNQEQAIRQSSQEIRDEFSRLTSDRRIDNAGKYADFVKAKIENARDTFRITNKTNYDAVHSLPEAQQEIFKLDGFARKAAEIKRNLPKKRVVEQVDTGLKDTDGNPVIKERIKNKPIAFFIPKEFRSLLDEAISLKGQGGTLADMQQMRSSINTLMDQSDAIPGLTNKRLSDFSHEITREIDRATEALPDGKFRTALERANKYYREEVGKYRAKGVRELLIDPNAPGGAQPIKTITNLYNDADAYRNIKNLLGESHPDFKIVQRHILDRFMADAGAIGVGGKVEGSRLLKALQAAHKIDGGFVIEDIMGKGLPGKLKAALIANTGARGRGTTQFKAPEFQMDLDEIMRQGASDQLSVQSLKRMIAKDLQANKLYQNRILDSIIGKGELPVDFDPSKFVSTFMRGSSNANFKQVMGMLRENPVLADNIRRKALQDFFMRADGARNPKELMQDMKWGTESRFTPKSMVEALGTETQRKNFEELVGSDTMEILGALAKVKAVQQRTDDLGGIAGGLIGGSIVNDMFSNPVKGAVAMTKYRLMSIILTNPKLNSALKGSPAAAKRIKNFSGKFGTAILATEPGIRAMIEEFGSEGELNNAIQVARGWLNTDAEALRAEIEDQKIDPHQFMDQ
jgi:hypothetical protein